MTYEEAVANHRWVVPERYNIAADVRQARARQARDGVGGLGGEQREVEWGEPAVAGQPGGERAARPRVERGDRVAVVAPASAETAAVFFGVWKNAAILL